MQGLRGTQCKRFFVLLFASWCLMRVAAAHDFWIEPDSFRPQLGARVPLHLHVGMDFKGDAALFNPEQFNRYTVGGPDGEHPVAANLGDEPAGSITIGKPGLYAWTSDS